MFFSGRSRGEKKRGAYKKASSMAVLGYPTILGLQHTIVPRWKV
jgi:hypothetical protein